MDKRRARSKPVRPGLGGPLAALLVGLVGLLVGGCTGLAPIRGAQASLGAPEPIVSVRPPPGVFYTNIRAPISLDFNQTTHGSRKGSATTYSIGIPFLWGGAARFAWGDASVDTAKAEGGIRDVHYTEYASFSILSVFTKFTVDVHGD
jgi:hypothetical protein